jgi:hypothetical protein
MNFVRLAGLWMLLAALFAWAAVLYGAPSDAAAPGDLSITGQPAPAAPKPPDLAALRRAAVTLKQRYGERYADADADLATLDHIGQLAEAARLTAYADPDAAATLARESRRMADDLLRRFPPWLTGRLRPDARRTVLCRSADDVRRALADAHPGDDVLLPDGWTKGVALVLEDRAFPLEAPLVVRAASPGAAHLWGGEVRLARVSGVVLEGIVLHGTDVDVSDAEHVRLAQVSALGASLRAEGVGVRADACFSADAPDAPPPYLPASVRVCPMLAAEYTFDALAPTKDGPPVTDSGFGYAVLPLALRAAPAALAAKRGPTRAGVSGRAGDLAFDNALATAMGGTGGAAAGSRDGPPELPVAWTSFTMCGWIRPVAGEPVAGGAVLAVIGGVQVLAPSGGTLALRTAGPGAREIASPQVFTETGQWVFFAVTYRAAEGGRPGRVAFHKGAVRLPVREVAVVEDAALGHVASGGLRAASLGGLPDGSAALDAALDNVRFYAPTKDAPPGAAALSLDALETLRRNDAAR